MTVRRVTGRSSRCRACRAAVTAARLVVVSRPALQSPVPGERQVLSTAVQFVAGPGRAGSGQLGDVSGET